jgi:hypothetical protein
VRRRLVAATLVVVSALIALPATLVSGASAEDTPATATATGSRQEVLAWLSAYELFLLHAGRAPSGINLDQLQASGVSGAVVMTSLLDGFPGGGWIPDWQVNEWRSLRNRGFDIYVGAYASSPTSPFTDLFDDSGWALVQSSLAAVADRAREANANGLALDVENYNAPDSMWSAAYPGNTRDEATTRAQMYQRAREIAPILASAGPLILYPSSIASFPGSYNDLVGAYNGSPDQYAHNLFSDFLRGLLDGGVDVTLLDGSFQFGVQIPGQSWDLGISTSVGNAAAAFPGLRAAPMIQPDNAGRGGFSAGEMRAAFDAATRRSTGPVVMYEETLAYGGFYNWGPTLDAISQVTSG